MKTIRFAVVVTVALLAAFIQSDALAASRNCTAEEKRLADARLMEIAGNEKLRDGLLRWHLRYGAHPPCQCEVRHLSRAI